MDSYEESDTGLSVIGQVVFGVVIGCLPVVLMANVLVFVAWLLLAG